jgi:hypothetical protein
MDKGYCPSCAATKREAKVIEDEPVKNISGKTEEKAEVTISPDEEIKVSEIEEIKKANKVWAARLKTAYSVCTKLALAGVLDDSEEVDNYVDNWMENGLTAKSMKIQGTLMLRSASNAQKRVSTSNAETSNTRTGEVNSVSTNPIFVANTNTGVNEIHDMKQAIESILMERFKQ